MADLDQLTDAVAELDPDERAELLNRLRFEESRESRGQMNPPTPAMENFYEALCAALGSLQHGRVPLTRFMAETGRRRLEDGVLAMDEFITTSCHAKLSKLERQQLRRHMLKALVEFVVAIPGFVVSAASVMRNLHFLPQAVNDAFPGYAEAGLLHFVVLRGRPAEKPLTGLLKVAKRAA